MAQINTMPFSLRPLKAVDIPQTVEIEREAYPSQLTPTPFQLELANRRVRYLVAWCSIGHTQKLPQSLEPIYSNTEFRRKITESAGHSTSLLNQKMQWLATQGQDFIVGFLGTWTILDQAHITSIGVRREYKGQGIGELLIIGALEQAIAENLKEVTLEVRTSNKIARNLYRKYGFKKRGVRKAYYSDNREDAIIMTTDHVQYPAYSKYFQQRKEEHLLRRGRMKRILSKAP